MKIIRVFILVFLVSFMPFLTNLCESAPEGEEIPAEMLDTVMLEATKLFTVRLGRGC